jgi:acetyltransferase-like isoleucine patch superfamily enzyme
MGPLVRVRGRARVKPLEGELVIGERVRLVGHVVPVEISVERGGSLIIGDRTFINYGTSIGATKSVTIGADCIVGPYVNIFDNHFHRVEPERRGERPDSLPVVIGDNVWLGARVIVLPGVTIGEGSVVGAGGVVTDDVPPRSLAVGSPARVVRTL